VASVLKSALISLRDLRQKPGSPFSLINPNLDQAGRRYVIVTVADLVHGSQVSRQLLVVIAKLADHLLRANAFLIVIFACLVIFSLACVKSN
jgi:hypothetical protein